MPLKIVTDSTADLPDQVARELDITVVPLTVAFGDEALLDHIDISAPEFYRRLATASEFPRTSQPSAGRFQQAFASVAATGATEILCVTISAKLSGTLNSARTAAGEALSGCRVYTLDSRSVSGGLGMMARTAATIAARGGTAEQAAAAASSLIERHQITIMLDTLEYLQKGGRIGRARALLGGLLNVKPIVRIEDGEVVPAERVRSRARGIERIYDTVVGTRDLDCVIVEHTGCAEDAGALVRRLQTSLPDVPIELNWIGPVVGAYAGPNSLGAITIQRVAEPD